MRLTLSLLTALAALALAPSAATAAGATVVRVVDGDTVRLTEGGRARTVDLLGVDAPEPADCHGAAATKALKRLLPAGARVQVQRDREAAGRYVKRAGKLVNEAMIRSGAARAGAVAGLSRAARLTAAQDAAQKATRGLWAACPAPQPQPQTQPPAQNPEVLTGAAAIQRARTDLQGRLFTRIRTTTFSSTESRLHLCSDGAFVEDVETHSDFGPPTHYEYRGRWEVIAAEYQPGLAGARVRRLNNDGTEGVLDVVAQGARITTNGEPASVAASNVCT